MPSFSENEAKDYLRRASLQEIADYIEITYREASLARQEMAKRLRHGDTVISSSGKPYHAELDEESGTIYIGEEIPF